MSVIKTSFFKQPNKNIKNYEYFLTDLLPINKNENAYRILYDHS